MQKLKDFFDLLDSPGGHLAVLIGLLVWIGTIAFVMHMTKHDPAETGRTLLTNAFTSLFTAVLVRLKGRD